MNKTVSKLDYDSVKRSVLSNTHLEKKKSEEELDLHTTLEETLRSINKLHLACTYLSYDLQKHLTDLQTSTQSILHIIEGKKISTTESTEAPVVNETDERLKIKPWKNPRFFNKK